MIEALLCVAYAVLVIACFLSSRRRLRAQAAMRKRLASKHPSQVRP